MGESKLVKFTVILLHFYTVATIELLANYKYSRSASDQFIYDYSGNSRHGTISASYMLTDRGLSPHTSYGQTFMSYKNPTLSDYTFSLWIYNNIGQGRFWFILYPDSGRRFVLLYNMDMDTNLFELEYRIDNIQPAEKLTTISSYKGWSLHTIRIYLDSNVVGRIHFVSYRNLLHLKSEFLDNGIPHTVLNRVALFNQEFDSNFVLILYELWIHSNFSDISELNSLLPISSCPNALGTVCFPTHFKTMNILGIQCSNTCLIDALSCNSNQDCIAKSKAECQYGLYDIETHKCLFYCPNNSCSCPNTITDPSTYTTFSCSCNLGYNKIFDDPTACMSKRCLSYNKVGYDYICNTVEQGYTLDSLGTCCICKSGYTQVSTNPVVCVNKAICITHILTAEDYTCSLCAKGYSIDSNGKCNQCSTSYINVLSDPFTCVPMIENCSNYIYNGKDLICLECMKGYLVDENSMCNKCEEGYSVFYTDSFTCMPGIDYCASYEIDGQGWKCMECREGYKLSLLGECNECQLGYVKIENENLVCKKEIGHCIEYDLYSEVSECILCEVGYAVGPDYHCSICDVGYIYITLNPLVCGVEILHCINYNSDEDSLKCLECESGYVLLSECTPEIPFCIKYRKIQDQYLCVKCQDGFKLESDNSCKCPQGYTYSNMECIIESVSDQDSITVSSEEEEAITETQKERGIIIKSSNFISLTIAYTSTSFSSMIAMDSSTLILYINTIQLISLIQYLNIPQPYEIRKQQSSTNSFMKDINIFSHMKSKGQDLNGYIRSSLDDENSFLAQSSHHLITLVIIVTLNCIIYCISRYSRGKINEIASKVLRYFKYTIYIQYFILIYLDITYNSLRKLVNVRYIQPKEDRIMNIIDYDLATLFSVTIIQTLSIISPFFFASIIKSIKLDLDTDSTMLKYGFLIKNYKDSILCVWYHVLFLIRRLSIVASVHLLDDSPYIQTSMCSLSCCAVIVIVGTLSYYIYQTF